jgi:asparagine synthase (glutamine-hydrolysing)
VCGICGLWQLDGRPVEPGEIQCMTDALAHRGPDGDGLYLDGSLGLGHRRLAILDLSPAGRQPMTCADGRHWITYNGEVYNFLELRAELEGRGYTFRSDSDTEVILAAYDAWGPDCLLRLNGMWAMAIWDNRERRLFLARDRFGIKPLFYVQQPHRFAFASEMKAFLRLAWFRPQVNWPVFKAELLDQHSQEGGDQCLLEGIRRLPPGHLAVVTEDGLHVTRWWQTRDHLVSVPRRLEDQVTHFRELFEDACRLRLRSDVPIGTSLSGGLDSSSVVCTVAHVAGQGGPRLANDWQRAFVACFPGTAVDERPYAEAVMAQVGAKPFYLEIQPEEALAAVESTIYYLEQLAIGPLVMLWLIYRHQRRNGVVVTLDGHGGDELLAGYPHYTLSALYDAGSWRSSPRRYLELLDIYRGLLRSPDDSGPQQGLDSVLWDTSSWLRNLRRLAARAGASLGPQPATNDGAGTWLSGDLAEVLPAAAVPASSTVGASLLSRTLYRDFHETVFPLILRNYDRMSMAHGVEVRMPFVDWRLVTYVFSLPPDSLLGQGYTKLILRQALRDLLPDVVRTRRDKIGFAAPMSQWIQSGWRAWLDDLLSSSAFLSSSLWNGRAIRSYARVHTERGDWTWERWNQVWRHVHAYLWLRTFAGGELG